ncbi:unnamed protein product [Toxocara canis]|uniref:Autophagy-related protein 2 n=1 Tax=Toxocara canis TaxID=6265 RepID=A0A183TXQ9_TOXCA|nr:unnamed protein product [Toxocara canis]
MTEWLSSFSGAVHKRVCRFLIHRYLSDFLKSKINLDQMSINLIGGTATVSEVDMDVQRLNEALDSARVPLTVIEGYIGEVNASVPWQNLPQKSCEIEIRQLQITLQPQQTLTYDNQADLVSSMISSVVGSLASSMELAQSFMKEEQQSDIEDRGVEQFAEVIDAIVSRFRLVFIDTTVRLEKEPDPESGLCTAIELQIDWYLFHTSKNSHRESESLNFLYSICAHELLKKPSSVVSNTVEDIHACMERESTMDSLAQSSVSNYQSCYSRVEGMEQSRSSFVLSPSVSPINEKVPDTFERLESNPIIFAQFADERHTVLVRVRNNSISTQDSAFANKEIKLFFGGLNVFLSPSQLYILNSVLGRVLLPSPAADAAAVNYGKPMKAGDYEQVETQLQARTNSSLYRGTDFQLGNWGGAMTFFDAQRKPSSCLDSSAEMANISLNTNDSYRSSSSAESRKESIASNITTKAGNRSEALLDQTHVRATLANFIFFLSHKDPLGDSNVRSRTLCGKESVLDVIKSLEMMAQRFFIEASGVHFNSQIRLSVIRHLCDRLYVGDHIR